MDGTSPPRNPRAPAVSCWLQSPLRQSLHRSLLECLPCSLVSLSSITGQRQADASSTLVFRCSSHPWDSRPFRGFVQRDICRRRSLPRKILGHAVVLHHSPRLGLPVNFQSPSQAFQQCIPIVCVEFETSPLLRLNIEILHRVVQPARCAHHRYRPISQAIYLVQAAGLVARWHQKDVRPGFNLMCECIVVGDLYTHRPRIFLANNLKNLSYSGLPVPRTTSDRFSFMISLATCAIRSNPFWSAKRETIPTTGRSKSSCLSAGSLKAFSKSFLQTFLPSRFCAE